MRPCTIALLLATGAAGARAQRLERSAAEPLPLDGGSGVAVAVQPIASEEDSAARRRRAPLWAPLASAIVPGAGQAWLQQDRFVAYLAVEVFAWIRFDADLREGRRQRRTYKRLARDVARAYFSDERPDGDFEYYERMRYWIESGVYDMVPGGDLEPETDPSTFNGDAWLLARQTYWPDPDTPPPPDSPSYRAALEFYQSRAIRPEYRWSWRNAQLEQDLYGRAISRSNAAFRRSVQDLGIVIANHALSTVDAYVTLRLRLSRNAGEPLRVSATVPWAPLGRPADAPTRGPR